MNENESVSRHKGKDSDSKESEQLERGEENKKGKGDVHSRLRETITVFFACQFWFRGVPIEEEKSVSHS